MRPELLDIPERRETSNVPELLKFFGVQCPDAPVEAAMNFIRCFAGTTFTMPGPEFFLELKRDEEIIDALEDNSSPERRIELLREHRITYRYMENLSRIGLGRNLEAPPAPQGRSQAIEAAAALVARHKNLANEIVMMFALTAQERSKVMAICCPTKPAEKDEDDMARKVTKRAPKAKKAVASNNGHARRSHLNGAARKAKPRSRAHKAEDRPMRLTKRQKSLVILLRDEGAQTPREIARLLKTISPTKTVRSLLELGMVTQPGARDGGDIPPNTKVKLTKLGETIEL